MRSRYSIVLVASVSTASRSYNYASAFSIGSRYYIAGGSSSALLLRRYSSYRPIDTSPNLLTRYASCCSKQRQYSFNRLHSTSEEASSLEETSRSSGQLTSSDLHYMSLALQHASIGKGGTYPNPAVGCVLVRRTSGSNDGLDTEGIIGQGFHPRAGMPHAEIFALFEACGHVADGVEAAKSVMTPTSGGKTKESSSNVDEMDDIVTDLLQTYSSEGGPAKLFGSAFTTSSSSPSKEETAVTAYVTLEPCCHYGQTPPCALSLKEAGVNRVVVGYRDPNPRVDGGGVKLLREAGVQVDVVGQGGGVSEEESRVAKQCAEIVSCFAKRIAPRPDDGALDYDSLVNGAKRRALRSLKERMAAEKTMVEITWPNRGTYLDTRDESVNLHELAKSLKIDPRWMEQLDEVLWSNELVLMRLGNAIKKYGNKKAASKNVDTDNIADELVLTKLGKAVSKKRGVKIVAARIADELGAHLAQVKGHTALLYRPGLPPVLDLDELIAGGDGGEKEEGLA